MNLTRLFKVKRQKTFTAQDIQDASDQFEILNCDEYITEINSKENLKLNCV